MQRILITGANRGLGLEFTRQYLEKGKHVFATCRHPERAADLKKLLTKFPETLSIQKMDVSDARSIESAHTAISKETDTIDLLINNAGVYSAKGSASPQETIGKLNFDDAIGVFRVDAIAPILVAQEFLDLLRASQRAKIVNLTSGYGSVSNNTSGYPYYYSSAKAALNQMTRTLAADIRKWNITVVLMDPGWVSTDMGGRGAPVSPQSAVENMIEIFERITQNENGQNLNRFGQRQDW